MQKNILCVLCALAAFTLISCDGNDKAAREFADAFVAAINTNDTATIVQLYPDAIKADSLALDFVADSLQVETNKTGDTIRYQFSQGVTMVAVKDAEGAIHAISSQGIFAYPAKRITFARRTGQYDASLTDVENAERMADTLFMAWMQNKALESITSLVKVTESTVERGEMFDVMGQCYSVPIKYTVVVSNETDEEISSDEYSVSAEITWFWMDSWTKPGKTIKSSPYSAQKTLKGKSIPAKGTVTYIWKEVEDGSAHGWTDDYAIQCTLNYSPKTTPSLDSYQPTGHEYKEYLKAPVATTEK